jgi:hypothetical protein
VEEIDEGAACFPGWVCRGDNGTKPEVVGMANRSGYVASSNIEYENRLFRTSAHTNLACDNVITCRANCTTGKEKWNYIVHTRGRVR